MLVYSFYDDDKPENFFRHLQMWLEQLEFNYRATAVSAATTRNLPQSSSTAAGTR